MARTSSKRTKPAPASTPDEVEAHVQGTVERWPQIDREVEEIVVRLGKADRLLQKAAAASLSRVGLTSEEFKVLRSLHMGLRSHGSLCRELLTSTGAMTNRLDKMERSGLLRRVPDPKDRRGVLLEITDDGLARLSEYVDLEAERERELLAVLGVGERTELNALLRKLLAGLQSELGSAPRRVELERTRSAGDGA